MFTYGNVLHGFAVTLTATELEVVRTVPGVLAVEENAEVAVDVPGAGSLFRGPRGHLGHRPDRPARPAAGRHLHHHRHRRRGEGVRRRHRDRRRPQRVRRPGRQGLRLGRGRPRRAGLQRPRHPCRRHGRRLRLRGGEGRVPGRRAGPELPGARHLGRRHRRVRLGGQGRCGGRLHPRRPERPLGGARSRAVDAAVEAVADAGVLPVVAAGNDDSDACDGSPAAADGVVTVGASDRQDRETSFRTGAPASRSMPRAPTSSPRSSAAGQLP
ncbi:Peptidase inhibitor I9 OS=Streptomyces microflavus OX=1919 GN=Smic_01990 PE=3 SV=1 [Streptomyces microflavus]